MRLVQRALAAGAIIGLSLAAPAIQVSATTNGPSAASFEGRQIDLSKGWGEARACNVGPSGIECFRSESEMDATLTVVPIDSAQPASVTADCSTPVRLYDSTGFGGTLLSLSTRGVWLSLSTYGFANRTSSYKIGACASSFKDGGGSIYPGSTAANAQAGSMVSGWDNRVTSVYIG